MERPAVIIIDLLNDFITGQLRCERAMRIIPNIKKLTIASHKHRIPVIYSNDAHLPLDEEVIAKWGKHAMKGTKGAKVIPELEPTKKDYTIEKRTYSGFYETGLDMLLRSLYHGEGAKTIILTGLHTNMCVRHTAADAFFRGYKIIVAEDAVEAFTKEDHQQGLAYLKNVYNAQITTVHKITNEFK
jgi:nicotinamidase-related amidase